MKKFIKRLLAGFIILIVLLSSSIYVIITFYKDDLEIGLTQQLKESYGLDLKIKTADVSFFSNWPHVSIKLADVQISNHSVIRETPLVKAGSISLSFDALKLWQGKFVIKYLSVDDAEISLLRDLNGNANFEFKKKDSADGNKNSAIDFALKKLSIRKTNFNFRNAEKGQDISISFINSAVSLQNYEDGFSSELNGTILVNHLLFNPKAGEFLKYARAKLDLRVNFFKYQKRVCITPGSTINIENQRYSVATLIDFNQQQLTLYIDSKNIKYEKTARLLTPKIQKALSNFEVKRPFNANVLVVAKLGKQEEPVLIVNVEGKKADLTIGSSKIPYSDLSFKGRIVSIDSTKIRGDLQRAYIQFSPITGKLYDFPFTATVNVTNLKTPSINIKANLDIEARKIKFKLEKEFVLNGSATAELSYSGLTSKLNKDSFLDKDMKLNADLVFKNLSYRPKNTLLEYKLNGNAKVDNKCLKFDNLVLQTAIGNAVVKGGATNFIPYVLGYSSALSARVAATSQHINLNPLLVTKNKAANENQKQKNKSKLQKIRESNADFHVVVHTKRLTIRSVEAQNVNATLVYRNRTVDVISMGMNSCDGTILAKGTMFDFRKLNAEVAVKDVNVVKLFTEFENFGQTAIDASNLKGKIDVEATFSADLDNKTEIIPETMIGEVKLKLKEGHLINFEPIQNLSNFLFKNRDFNDVTFTDLIEKFSVKGHEIRIRELEIASSVLNLYVVNGIYNFKGNSNLNLLIPWNNLKRRGKDYVATNIGERAENVRGLKLNYSGPPKKMKISLGHRNLD